MASLDETLRSFGTELEQIPGKQVQLARLERQTSVLEEIYTLLQTRLKEAQIARAVEDPSVRVLDPAILPAEPVKPRTILNLALALVLGSMLGVGTAFTREYLDDTVHTREDVQAATGGVPVLGLIPRIRTASGNGRPARRKRRGAPATDADDVRHLEERLVAGRDTRNPVSEAYRNLRTNITFSRAERTPKTLVFTSPLPRDGKSTSAANLAITLAQQGLDVILVDADLRRGVLHSVFDRSREPGLSQALLGREPLDAVVQEVELGESGKLDFVATGTLPPNPAELLGSKAMEGLLEELESRYEVVILDSPPLNVVTDAAVLGTKTDGVILIARASSTESGALRYAVEQLRNVGGGALGTVLNDVDFRKDGQYYSYGSYGYGYQYYYGSREA